MLLSEKTTTVAWSVDDYGKQVQNIAAENAHVESFYFVERCKLAAKCNFAGLIVRETDLSLDLYGIDSEVFFAKTPPSDCA